MIRIIFMSQFINYLNRFDRRLRIQKNCQYLGVNDVFSSSVNTSHIFSAVHVIAKLIAPISFSKIDNTTKLNWYFFTPPNSFLSCFLLPLFLIIYCLNSYDQDAGMHVEERWNNDLYEQVKWQSPPISRHTHEHTQTHTHTIINHLLPNLSMNRWNKYLKKKIKNNEKWRDALLLDLYLPL